MRRVTPPLHSGRMILATCAAFITACPGCTLWVSNNTPIRQSDIRVTDPYDGSQVYSLNVVALGSDQRLRNLVAPLRLLEERMHEDSQYAVIRAADCGILACYVNDMALAARALDRALGLSEAAMADEHQVSSASGVAGSERTKMFAGEPHEVATLYVFRGLVFLAENDPENAKACFLSASLADAMATQDESRSNWLTADVLTALSFRLYGNDVRATDHVEMIRATYPQAATDNGWVDGAALAGINSANLVIVIIAVGNHPIKYGQGVLQYAEAGSNVGSVLVNGSVAWLTDNVYVQAVTRGRRQMDNILAARQKRREGTETAGSVALGLAGAIGGLVGSAIQLIAGAMIDKAQQIDTDADSRQVGALPGKFYVWVRNSVRCGEELSIELRNRVGKPIASGAIGIPATTDNRHTVVLGWFPG